MSASLGGACGSQLARPIYLSGRQLGHLIYQGVFYDSSFSDISRTSTKPHVKPLSGVAGASLARRGPQLQTDQRRRKKEKGTESPLSNSFGLLIETPAPFIPYENKVCFCAHTLQGPQQQGLPFACSPALGHFSCCDRTLGNSGTRDVYSSRFRKLGKSKMEQNHVCYPARA